MEKKSLTHTIEFVVIGGSSGSLKVILELLELLHPKFSVPVLMVLHRNNQQESLLTSLLAAKTKIQVKEVEEKEQINTNTIYIAPQDYHVLVEDDRSFSLDYSEKTHFSRPSIDVSFTSAAVIYQQHLLCILLSGANADGTKGFEDIKENGGVTIAQKPETAEISYMPENAINNDVVDMVLTTDEIAAYLNEL